MNRRRLAGTLLAALALVAGAGVVAGERYAMRGLVLAVDPSHRRFVVSHESVPDLMPAMAMPFDVRESTELEGVVPGMMVEFTLVIEPDAACAEQIRIRRYEAVEQDPLTAQRLALLKEMIQPASPEAIVAIGETVPDFTLVNQARQPVTLSSLRGKVVALNFVYTSCALPQFCFRMANHFGMIQRRLGALMGEDVTLLTVTFDPARDRPERLAEYAKQWKADPRTWHFLTGDVPDVRRVCSLFGVQAFREEGLVNHSTRTAVIDRQGRLAANIEGNEYTTAQLADLLETVARRR
jgi:protein SCO1/2